MKESTEGGKEGGQEERHKQKERTEERRKAKFQERKNAVPALHRSLAVPNSATGTRTRVARVRAEYPNQLDYSGLADASDPLYRARSPSFLCLRQGRVLPFVSHCPNQVLQMHAGDRARVHVGAAPANGPEIRSPWQEPISLLPQLACCPSRWKRLFKHNKFRDRELNPGLLRDRQKY